MNIQNNIIRYALGNAYFINGTAYAGKSTMVRLLAEKYDGVACGENYHEALMEAIDSVHQPDLSYIRGMRDWQQFISRTPEEYDRWIMSGAREAADLEVVLLLRLSGQGKPLFVDTNISPAVLKEISDYSHVALMLSPQSMSVERFFDREDRDKQFLYRQIQLAPDPAWAMENFKNCLKKINSPEHYREFAESGLFTYTRREDSTLEQALSALERHFGLG